MGCLDYERLERSRARKKERLLKKPLRVELSYVENPAAKRAKANCTPPLRVGLSSSGGPTARRGRKPEAALVGGAFSVACPPTESAFVQRTRPLRLPLKGGVVSPRFPVGYLLRITKSKLFQQPRERKVCGHLPLHGEYPISRRRACPGRRIVLSIHSTSVSARKAILMRVLEPSGNPPSRRDASGFYDMLFRHLRKH